MKKQTNLGRRLEKVETGNIWSISYFTSIFTIYWIWFKPSCTNSVIYLNHLWWRLLKTWVKTSLSSLSKYLCLRGNLQLRFQLLSWIRPRRLWLPCWNHGAAGWKRCNVTFTRGIWATNSFLWVWEGDGVCILRLHPTTCLSCTEGKKMIAGFIIRSATTASNWCSTTYH